MDTLQRTDPQHHWTPNTVPVFSGHGHRGILPVLSGVHGIVCWMDLPDETEVSVTSLGSRAG